MQILLSRCWSFSRQRSYGEIHSRVSFFFLFLFCFIAESNQRRASFLFSCIRRMDQRSRIGRFCRTILLLFCAYSFQQVALVNAHRIDLHTHFIPPFYREYLEERHVLAGGIPTPPWNVSWHLAFMEQLGIQTSVVAITTPGARIHPNDTLEGRALARKLNEYAYYELVLKFPGRFQFWATVTLPDVEGSISEAVYAFEKLGAVGIFLEANKFGVYLGDPSLDPFFQVLNDYNAIVFLHPNALPNDAGVPGLPSAAVDFTLDTTRAALNLVFKNTTRKYPNVKYVLAHSGGFLPFVVYRFAFGAMDTDAVLEQFKDFYFDTALSSSPSALPSTLEIAKPERITYGTDFPYASMISLKRFTDALDTFDMPGSQREGINCSNALKLFHGFANH